MAGRLGDLPGPAGQKGVVRRAQGFELVREACSRDLAGEVALLQPADSTAQQFQRLGLVLVLSFKKRLDHHLAIGQQSAHQHLGTRSGRPPAKRPVFGDGCDHLGPGTGIAAEVKVKRQLDLEMRPADPLSAVQVLLVEPPRQQPPPMRLLRCLGMGGNLGRGEERTGFPARHQSIVEPVQNTINILPNRPARFGKKAGIFTCQIKPLAGLVPGLFCHVRRLSIS